MKKNIFNLQNSIFESSIVREVNRTADGSYYNYTFKSNEDLKYDSKKGENQSNSLGSRSKFGRLYSTKELNIDFSKFENHTFFDSAVSKTNIAFDRVINLFPFDQTRQDIENFKENSTGYEDYILRSFPKNKGYLHFIGDSNQFISVKDMPGYLYSAGSEKRTSTPVFSPLDKGLSIEFWIRIPAKSNDRQVICQLVDSSRAGFSIALDTQPSTSISNLRYTLMSGSNSVTLSSTIDKGKFVHLASTYDNKEKITKLFINGVQKITSSMLDFDNLEMRQSDLLIGSGSAYDIDASTFTPQSTFSGSMDEFRFYHGAKSKDAINLNYLSPTYKDDELGLDLVTYFKFNEPQGSYTGNNLVLDCSGNNLHSQIINYAVIMRQTSSIEPCPLTKENIKDCHVLFANHTSVTNLNSKLLVSASLYDDYNPNLITHLIPQHYLLEGQHTEGFANLTGSLGNAYKAGNLPSTGRIGNNQLLISFLLVWAKYFDELKLYVDNLSNILHTSYENFQGSSPNFYKLIAENKGIVLPNIINSNVDYLKFNEAEGINNLNTNSSFSLNEFQNEIWKRLLINIKSIQKEKGTKRSLKSLMNIFGLDFERYFDFKEYGGIKAHYLEDLREHDKKLIRFLDFSGSVASRSDIDKSDLDSHGFSAGTYVPSPYMISPFLSSSRVEVGYPNATDFVQKGKHPPHGISNVARHGLFTSGSFTYEAVYKFLPSVDHHKTQSLARFAVTGTHPSPAGSGGLISNLIAIDESDDTKLKLFMKNHTSTDASDILEVQIHSASIFDGYPWYVSFGRVRNDDIVFYGSDKIKNAPSSSFFLRCGRIDGSKSEVFLTTASFYNPKSKKGSYTDWLSNTHNQYNASGSFLIIGSQSITQNSNNRFLNDNNLNNEVRYTNFSGQVGFIKFHTRGVTEKESREKIRNPFSIATKDPKVNYNHNLVVSNSFGRIRIDASISKQLTTGSDNNGVINIFDNSQNGFHLTAKMFEPSKKVIKTNQIAISRISTNFDERVSSDKVRVRSYQLKENLDKSLYAKSAPIYDVTSDESPHIDRRVSIDMSSIKGLNEDISKMFDSLEVFDSAIGDFRESFEESYIDLEKIRQVYFKDLLYKIDLESNTKFFTWFDNSFTDLISSLMPLETVFLGVNYIVEPHNLERNRLRYHYNKQYLTIEDESTNDQAVGTIFG